VERREKSRLSVPEAGLLLAWLPCALRERTAVEKAMALVPEGWKRGRGSVEAWKQADVGRAVVWGIEFADRGRCMKPMWQRGSVKSAVLPAVT
jgi:hypothetical protein